MIELDKVNVPLDKKHYLNFSSRDFKMKIDLNDLLFKRPTSLKIAHCLLIKWTILKKN